MMRQDTNGWRYARKNQYVSLGAMFVMFACGLFLSSHSAAAQQKPNIILITADDMGTDDVGVYGHPVHTPNLDQLARAGIRFNNFYVTTSSCSPSRSSFWTGKYPHATGAENLHDPLPADQMTIAGFLQKAGYYTGNVGKLHLGNRPAVLAQFDVIIDNIFQNSQSARDHKGIDQFLDNRPKNKPFFLGIGYSEPHRGYNQRTPIPDPHDPDLVWVPPYLPDVTAVREDIANYYDEINWLDASFGKLMERLRDEGLESNTLIIFFSDNGMPFPRAKTTVYDSGVRLPCIISWPGHVPEGAVSNAFASSVDIAPTILDIVGIDIPDDIQGKSALESWQNPAATGREYVFFERNWHNFDDHTRAVRWKNLKYIRYFYPNEPYYMASDLIGSPSYQAMVQLLDRGKLTPQQTILFHAFRPEEALYDLQDDPFEFRNLAFDPSYQNDLAHLRSVLADWLVETNDTGLDERNYHNVLIRSGTRLYPSRGLQRRPVDFDKMKQEQAAEERRLNNQ